MSMPDSPISRTDRGSRVAARAKPAQSRRRGAPPQQQAGSPGPPSGNKFVAALVRAAELSACGVVSLAIIFLILGVIGVIALAFYKL